MLAMEPGLRSEFKGELVLTPHPGEMSRLLGRKIGRIDGGTIRLAGDYAKLMNAWIVLRSADTLVFDPAGGQVWVNSTGNAGLAKAGSGDVLAGILAGVLSQKAGLRTALGSPVDMTRALCFAVWLHGRAADLAAEHTDMRSMLATDVIGNISSAYRTLQAG
jgi:NAD(P)H-hydrate epimerase